MNKGMIYLGATVGGVVGSYVPVVLFHAGGLSGASILGGLIGGIAGVWLGYKFDSDY